MSEAHFKKMAKGVHDLFEQLLGPLNSPDSSVSVDTLKNIVKTGLGDRYSDQQLDQALQSIGVPCNGKIKINDFVAKLSTPTVDMIHEMRKENLGAWLSVDEWHEVLNKLGMHLNKEEISAMVLLTKNNALAGSVKEKLALEKIGLDLSMDDVQKIVADAQVARYLDDSSEYETEEENTIYDDEP